MRGHMVTLPRSELEELEHIYELYRQSNQIFMETDSSVRWTVPQALTPRSHFTVAPGVPAEIEKIVIVDDDENPIAEFRRVNK